MFPILIKIGAIELRSYGVMIALAFVVGTWLGVREARRKGFDPELIYDLLFVVMLSSLAGARLYYVLVSEPLDYLRHPWEILAIWNGGMSLHGGLLGGLLAGLWFTRSHRLPFWRFADTVTPSIMLGQAVGRMACVLNGCSYGKPTSLPWAIIFTNPHSAAPHNVPLHPTQFYELSTDLTLFGLLWLFRKRMTFDGQLFLLYWMSYGVARLILESFRGDSLMVGGLIPVPQLASAVILLLAGSVYLNRRRAGHSPEPAS
ncbi:MAG: prolipoprotein diacylglyceryl transferase [Nitrospirae bacterium]|nr:prolipoprotein diacylglyceryl transferase [Nitrospirota bacterium]